MLQKPIGYDEIPEEKAMPKLPIEPNTIQSLL